MTGADKKLNFPVYKGIKITEDQEKNWNAENIRKYLDGNGDYENNMNTRILHDKIDNLEKFKEGYKQFNTLFETLMKNANILFKSTEMDTLKRIIKENIDIGLIKKINEGWK